MLVVDGYNVIRADSALSELFDKDADIARSRLVEAVSRYATHNGAEATIVFDAAANPDADGVPQDVGGVAVVFSAAGTDADEVVERLVRAGASSGREVAVATSDSVTQWTVIGRGVVRLSAREFLRELDGSKGVWSEEGSVDASRHRVEDAIPPDVRERLMRLAKSDSADTTPEDT